MGRGENEKRGSAFATAFAEASAVKEATANEGGDEVMRLRFKEHNS